LMKGGETGVAIVPGKSSASLLVKMIEGNIQKDGETLIMPPGKKRKKLDAQEIATVKAWIDAGAKPPAIAIVKEVVVPKIELKVAARNPINALAHIPNSQTIALARYTTVEIRS